MKWLLALAVSVAPAFGQSVLSNDYDFIFETWPGEVERRVAEDGKTIEEIFLPGRIKVQRRIDDEGPVYRAIDLSDAGAVGCMMGIMMDFKRVATQCDGKMSADQVDTLDGGLDRITEFFASYRVPPVPVEDVQSAIARYSTGGENICARADQPDFKSFYEAVLSPNLDGFLDELLATPRLPVVNPCL